MALHTDCPQLFFHFLFFLIWPPLPLIHHFLWLLHPHEFQSTFSISIRVDPWFIVFSYSYYQYCSKLDKILIILDFLSKFGYFKAKIYKNFAFLIKIHKNFAFLINIYKNFAFLVKIYINLDFFRFFVKIWVFYSQNL